MSCKTELILTFNVFWRHSVVLLYYNLLLIIVFVWGCICQGINVSLFSVLLFSYSYNGYGNGVPNPIVYYVIRIWRSFFISHWSLSNGFVMIDIQNLGSGDSEITHCNICWFPPPNRSLRIYFSENHTADILSCSQYESIQYLGYPPPPSKDVTEEELSFSCILGSESILLLFYRCFYGTCYPHGCSAKLCLISLYLLLWETDFIWPLIWSDAKILNWEW